MTGTGNLILWSAAGICAAACLFILTLLLRATLRRIGRNDRAALGANRKMLRELGWTVAWVMIVTAIGVPALRLLYLQSTYRVADLTINVTGNLWHWTYEYPDHGNFGFDAPMLSPDSASPISTVASDGSDNHIVVPVDETVRIVTIGTDLIYSWEIPAIGAKVMGLPGRNNESWFKADKEGVYFGECNELCTLRHTFRPIKVEVVSRERFDRWVAEASERFAAVPTIGAVVATQ